MAGYSKIYCIGGLGGFMGSDGINPIDMQIWVGDANRQWYEAHYFNKDLKPIGEISRIVPEGPNDDKALLDSCLAFLPSYFEDCPSMAVIKEELQSCTFMDFDMGKNVPARWNKLREEARQYFKDMIIFEASLNQIEP